MTDIGIIKVLVVLIILVALCIIGLLISPGSYNYGYPPDLSPVPHQTRTIRVFIIPNSYTPTPDYDK